MGANCFDAEATPGAAPRDVLDDRDRRSTAALDAVETLIRLLDHEVTSLDAEHGSRAPTAAVRQVLLRMLPDVCGLLAPHLYQLEPGDAIEILDRLFAKSPFGGERMRRWAPRLRAHLDAYVASLSRWHDWEPLNLEDFGPNGTLQCRAAWERPGDGAVAGDFVGYVKDPADFAHPGRAFSVFLRDASAFYRELLEEYGDGQFKGLRLWIVGADERPVVRWLTHDDAGLDCADRGL